VCGVLVVVGSPPSSRPIYPPTHILQHHGASGASNEGPRTPRPSVYMCRAVGRRRASPPQRRPWSSSWSWSCWWPRCVVDGRASKSGGWVGGWVGGGSVHSAGAQVRWACMGPHINHAEPLTAPSSCRPSSTILNWLYYQRSSTATAVRDTNPSTTVLYEATRL